MVWPSAEMALMSFPVQINKVCSVYFVYFAHYYCILIFQSVYYYVFSNRNMSVN